MEEKCDIIDQLDVIREKLKGIADTFSMISEHETSVLMSREQMTFFELSIREIEDQVTAICDGLNGEDEVMSGEEYCIAEGVRHD